MTRFYRDEEVRISSSDIVIGERRYRLAELEYVWHRRTRRFARAGFVLATRVGAVVLALGLVIGAVVLVASLNLGPNKWYILAGISLVVTVLAALAGFGVDPLLELLDQSHEQGHGSYELWARIRGREALLFSTLDGLRFGKVYRALQRAIDHDTATRRPPPAAPPQFRS
jgi:hypothetical protein